jgi:hypothetical protein
MNSGSVFHIVILPSTVTDTGTGGAGGAGGVGGGGGNGGPVHVPATRSASAF